MLFKVTFLYRSAFTELLVVGSRWRRVFAKSISLHTQQHDEVLRLELSSQKTSAKNLSPLSSVLQSSNVSASPYITIIPTLHVASLKFYDRVLEYVQQATKKTENCVVLLEGICDSPEAANQQMNEYEQIATDAKLREVMSVAADKNTLFSEQTIEEMCRELKVNHSALMRYEETVRLQECYLKPKMAALCASHLSNKGDLTMMDIKLLLEKEAVRRSEIGEPIPSAISVSELGTFPLIRKERERKVARLAREYCEKWLVSNVEGEVIVPWGYFHADAIIHYILEKNKIITSSSDDTLSPKNEKIEHNVASSSTSSPSLSESTMTSNQPEEELTESSLSTSPSQQTTVSGEKTQLTQKDVANALNINKKEHTGVIFIESDVLLEKLSYGLPQEVLETNEASQSAQCSAESSSKEQISGVVSSTNGSNEKEVPPSTKEETFKERTKANMNERFAHQQT